MSLAVSVNSKHLRLQCFCIAFWNIDLVSITSLGLIIIFDTTKVVIKDIIMSDSENASSLKLLVLSFLDFTFVSYLLTFVSLYAIRYSWNSNWSFWQIWSQPTSSSVSSSIVQPYSVSKATSWAISWNFPASHWNFGWREVIHSVVWPPQIWLFFSLGLVILM